MIQAALGQINQKLFKKTKEVEGLRWLEEWHRKHHFELGDYLEFGCYKGTSAVRFYESLKTVYGDPLPKDRYHMYLFDSFVGLPPSEHQADQHHAWKPGEFDVGGPENFKKIMLGAGLPEDRFTLVVGFYDQSLKKFDFSKIKRASFVYMDCDLYTSTATALEGIRHKLDNYSLIYFDDLHSFSGNPHKGQHLAINEFNAKSDKMGIAPCPTLSHLAEGRMYWVWKD